MNQVWPMTSGGGREEVVELPSGVPDTNHERVEQGARPGREYSARAKTARWVA